MGSIHRNDLPELRPRSYLYVPGDRAAVLDKALESDADVVVADLEDAVPADRKAVARENVLAALRAGPGKPLHVRIPGDGGGAQELAALATSGVELVRLAKVSAAHDVDLAAQLLSEREAPATLMLGCLIESALGVENAFAIASAHPRVASIALGEADLRADLGVSDDTGLLYARSRIVTAARAAGLRAPVQSVFTNVKDLDGLRSSCVEGRALGFYGRSVIHPRQIAVVHEVYGITEQDSERAQALLDGSERAQREGVFLLEDGQLVDAATLEHARALRGERR